MKMKRFVLTVSLLMTLVLLCAACQNASGQEQRNLRSELTFPDTGWNMTPEELMTALNLSAGDCETVTETFSTYTGYSIRVDALTIFGAEAGVRFDFADFTGDGVYGLSSVLVGYPAGTDMQAVRERMEQRYGAGQTDSDASGAIVRWQTEEATIDSLSQKQADEFLSYLEENDMAVAKEHVQTASLTQISWSDQLWRLFGLTESEWQYPEEGGIQFSSGVCAMEQLT